MIPAPLVRSSLGAVLAAAGAFLGVLSVSAGPRPEPLLTSLQGTGVTAVVLFAAFTACGLWIVRRASGSAWRWATGIGAALTAALITGLSFRVYGDLDGELWRPELRGWLVVHALGTAWLLICALAALIHGLDAYGEPTIARRRRRGVLDDPADTDGRSGTGPAAGSGPASPRRIWAILLVVLVASRIPYLVTYWPGIVWYDTLRSYSYVRGLWPWESYEPVGSSLIIGSFQWLGTAIGAGDAGGVAISSITYILVSSAVYALMFTRMAVWGVPRAVWLGGVAFVALLPVLGYFSIYLIKDVPFSIALLLFLVACGELSLGPAASAQKWWPWIALAASGVVTFATRNNGIHVLVLSVLLLFVVLRHLWKRLAVVALVLGAAFALYAGPLATSLRVLPGPAEEPYSVPLQQLARIAKYDAASLTPSERTYLTTIFDGTTPEELGTHYVPGLSDPMKLTARRAWSRHSTSEFLTGWARIAAAHPGTAIAATLANTQGYWDPDGAPYDGLNRWSQNYSEMRGVRLDIPSVKPTTGLAGAIEASGLMPTKTYGGGLQDDGYLAIPILGRAMAPGTICWVWLIGALLVVRRRSWRALAVFVPAGVCLLTFLAGPVSGGQRYALSLFMALPLVAAAVVLSARGRVTAPAAEAAPARTEGEEESAAEATPPPADGPAGDGATTGADREKVLQTFGSTDT